MWIQVYPNVQTWVQQLRSSCENLKETEMLKVMGNLKMGDDEPGSGQVLCTIAMGKFIFFGPVLFWAHLRSAAEDLVPLRTIEPAIHWLGKDPRGCMYVTLVFYGT